MELPRPTPAEAMALPPRLDYKNLGSQTVLNGRRVEARIAFHLPVDATEAQIGDWLAFELGGGSIHNTNPLKSCDLNDVDVEQVEISDQISITHWGDADPRTGRRSGKTYAIFAGHDE